MLKTTKPYPNVKSSPKRLNFLRYPPRIQGGTAPPFGIYCLSLSGSYSGPVVSYGGYPGAILQVNQLYSATKPRHMHGELEGVGGASLFPFRAVGNGQKGASQRHSPCRKKRGFPKASQKWLDKPRVIPQPCSPTWMQFSLTGRRFVQGCACSTRVWISDTDISVSGALRGCGFETEDLN